VVTFERDHRGCSGVEPSHEPVSGSGEGGKTLTITEHGRVVAVLSPASDESELRRPRPRVGGYRSDHPLSAEEIDAELAQGFGDHDRR
jgi:antitoxin (DNA-binding transcriptional repressor) of toxin-antitoxin stability system